MAKNALITGGNSGIGFAAARIFRDRGYEVTISGRNPEALARAADELGVASVRADMAELPEVEGLAEPFLAEGLDVLVNSAALAGFKPIAGCTASDFDRMFQVNVRGPLMLIRALLPALEKRRGAVVNVSSAVVRKAAANTSLYAASKGAMDALTRSLAKELSPGNIRVNAVAPGAVETPMFGKLGLDDQALQAIRKMQENNIPMGRYGRPEEVARVIAELAESTYVTGAVWRVDGGVTV